MSRRMGCVRKYMIRNTIYKLGLKLANLLLRLLTNSAVAGAGSLAKLQLRFYLHGGKGDLTDEMQNNAS